MPNAYKNARASKCHQMHVKQRSNIFPIYLLFIYLFIYFLINLNFITHTGNWFKKMCLEKKAILKLDLFAAA